MSTTGYFRQNASRFQDVVAMWVFVGAVLLVVARIILGLGFVALHFTRKWHRHGMVPAPSYPGTR